jgi:hypothetical protein
LSIASFITFSLSSLAIFRTSASVICFLLAIISPVLVN